MKGGASQPEGASRPASAVSCQDRETAGGRGQGGRGGEGFSPLVTSTGF